MKTILWLIIVTIGFVLLSFLFIIDGHCQSKAESCFDSTELAYIELQFDNAEYYQAKADTLQKMNSSLVKQNSVLEIQNAMKDSIVTWMDFQLKRYENTPIVKEVIKTKWYTWLGVIVSSIAAGLITGIIIK